jgi:hypothetical protein
VIEEILKKIAKDKNSAISCLGEIVSSCDDWLNSIIQEPSVDFIKAIRDYTKKELDKIQQPNDIHEIHMWKNGKFQINRVN